MAPRHSHTPTPEEIKKRVLAIQAELEVGDLARKRSPDNPERVEQINAARCNVVPLPRVATRPFRTELTIEQSSLFVANNYKGDFFVRESIAHHPESGEEVIRRMTVGRLHEGDRARGVLRQMHQDAFYKVLQLWGKQGYPVGQVRGKVYGLLQVTAYELVKELFGDDSAGRYKRARELLRDLSAIPVVLENVYTWQGQRDREEFQLLAEVTWHELRIDPDTRTPDRSGTSEVTILLSSLVTEGFLAKHIKILLADPYEALGGGKGRKGKGRRGEIARLLYPFLDAQLVKKHSYHSKLDALSERFGLKRYDYPSKRKEKFEPAVRELNEKLIHEGKHVLRVWLALAADGSDYVLHAQREAAPKSSSRIEF